MDLIGGGAKNYSSFLQYMGDERPGLGSPFQINFPLSPPPHATPLNIPSRSCSDSALDSRCTCLDCPGVCPALPPITAPSSDPTCTVGSISCLTFVLTLAYAVGVVAFFTGYGIQRFKRRRKAKGEALALSGDTSSNQAPSLDSVRGMAVAPSVALLQDGDDSSRMLGDQRNLGRGPSLMDPMDTLQPRHYRLNTFIRRVFYRIGLLCAASPWVTLAVAFTFIGLLNIGWQKFSVETDPVRLWVSPTSDTKLQKEFFDSNFGPFYRTQQVFVTALPTPDNSSDNPHPPVLSWDRLRWLFDMQKDIRELKSSPHGYTLHDVCFKPAGPRGPCVVQSVAAWFGDDLGDYDPDTWADQVVQCANNPGGCLPDYGQPLSPKYVLGGIPSEDISHSRWLSAEALVVTYVVSNSLDEAEKARAEEWERSLRTYLGGLKDTAAADGVEIAYSTEISLEEEINQSTNTDYKIVVLSYLVMFFYISFTLGGGSGGGDKQGGILATIRQSFKRLPGRRSTQDSTSSYQQHTPYTQFSRRLLVGSKFTLGLFGIILVVISVSTSIGFFSLLGVKVTLIIAEVIPFLVLAVGVDNVFILVHELDRQNALHGPNASQSSASHQATLSQTPMSPSSYRSPFNSSLSHDSEDAVSGSAVAHLSAEERVARTLARMGPSILLSTITETVAFALGALVPMPAVRNFALYAAGSVFLGAMLQVTAFVAALCIDLRREEVGTSFIQFMPRAYQLTWTGRQG